MTERRQFLLASALTFGGSIAGMPLVNAQVPRKTNGSASIVEHLAALEAGVDGRLGVALLDTGNGQRWAYRADERFPMCSTFKLLAAAALLKRVDSGVDRLDQRIVFQKEMLQAYSPTTSKHVGGTGLSLAQLCEAMVTLSDNTAANLVLHRLGGLRPFNRFIHSLGDSVTRLDRIEPQLNSAIPGDPRDTTSPAAMTASLQKVLLGNVLSDNARGQLIAWLKANQTGDKRVRAGLPADWKVGDKTGTGAYGTTNTLAIIWPPQRAPVLASLYLTQTKAPEAQRSAVLADIGRLIAERL